MRRGRLFFFTAAAAHRENISVGGVGCFHSLLFDKIVTESGSFFFVLVSAYLAAVFCNSFVCAVWGAFAYFFVVVLLSLAYFFNLVSAFRAFLVQQSVESVTCRGVLKSSVVVTRRGKLFRVAVYLAVVALVVQVVRYLADALDESVLGAGGGFA